METNKKQWSCKYSSLLQLSSIYNGNDEIVCHADKEDVEMIIKAVNVHDELVTALNDLVNNCEWIPKETFTEKGKIHFQNGIDAANAILKKVYSDTPINSNL